MKTCLKICALMLVVATLTGCSSEQTTAFKSSVKGTYEKVKTYSTNLVTSSGQKANSAATPVVEEPKTAIVFDVDANFEDHSFHQMAASGAKKAATELKAKVDMVTVPKDKSREGFYRLLIEDGYTHIIGIGYQNVLPVIELANENPDIKFTVVDGLAPPSLPNVKSIRFRDNEGSFLVGMIAAETSKTGKIGFIGALDIPLIQDFASGYEQGARHVKPSVQIVKQTITSDKSPWNDPVAAAASATQIMDQGADVIYAAAGASGSGALKAAAEKGKFAIGVDFNQNAEFPGKVLTSMIKRLDTAVYNDIKDEQEDKWQPGKVELGLAESGVDYIVDENNKSLIPDALKNKVEQARQGIISGKLKVFSFREKVEQNSANSNASSVEPKVDSTLPASLPSEEHKVKEGAN